MLPKTTLHAPPKPVQRLEVIAPDGRIHIFPRPSWSQCFRLLLQRHAGTAAISTIVLVLIYAAGMAAQALDGSLFDACEQQRPPSTS